MRYSAVYTAFASILLILVTTSNAYSSNNATVEIVKNAKDVDNGRFYVPSTITIEVGSTVTWVNNDDGLHTVTDGTKTSPKWGTIFDSPVLEEGDKFSFTFDKEGEYDYLCVFHPWMAGKVIVLPKGGKPIPKITLTTSKMEYRIGESIKIEGIVSPVTDKAISVSLLERDKVVLSVDTYANNDGTFHIALATDKDAIEAGSYTLKVSYLGAEVRDELTLKSESEGGNVKVKIAMIYIKDFVVLRITNFGSSTASIDELSFSIPDHTIEAFKGPKSWSGINISDDTVKASSEIEPLKPGSKIYFKLKADSKIDRVHWIAYNSSGSVLSEGDVEPLRK